ncbi:hypothetical protein E4U14_003318 [Claviceps sp. LM454 group G7]|nr:hypothetical protein E4U14_003318 [Claviceps sp. LM454 group G7]
MEVDVEDGMSDQEGRKESLDVDCSNNDREIGNDRQVEGENEKGHNDEDDNDDADNMPYDSSCSNSGEEDDTCSPGATHPGVVRRHRRKKIQIQRECPNTASYSLRFSRCTQHYTHDQRLDDLKSHFVISDKMDKVVHIPELFLLVIRSGLGRVMLVTPTRLARPIKKPTGVLRYGLRLEWVLPRRSDEAVYRANMRPLHGMAVGPVQEAGVAGRREGGRQAAMTPKRYRLMLHYRNHDILTYEISREEETGKICLFQSV